MKDFLLTLLHLAVVVAKLCGPGGVRAVIAENLLLKQQLVVLRRGRRRAPSLTLIDRLLCGFGSVFLRLGRIRKVAIALRPSTLLTFHQAEFQAYYNAARCHASLDGQTPLRFATGRTVARADLRHVRWVSYCRDLVHLPVAA